MRQLIIGVILAVCLVGCGEKPKFSINERDTKESYANNPAFTKVVPDMPANEIVVYKFTGAPETVYGFKTSDLEVLGGYISVNNKSPKSKALSLTAKGKADFDKLLNRVKQSDYVKDMNCMQYGLEKGSQVTFVCNKLGISEDNKRSFFLRYDPFTDSANFSLTYY